MAVGEGAIVPKTRDAEMATARKAEAAMERLNCMVANPNSPRRLEHYFA
jgi:hypothetical protein